MTSKTMTPQTYIFIGRAGSGKGTQAELLIKTLKEKDPQGSVFTLETGARFREFIKGGSYTSQLAKVIIDDGRLQPAFLSITMWAQNFIESFKEGQHIVLDGSPRGLYEAYAVDSAMKFYSRVKPFVIYLDVEESHSIERLLKRGRADDVHHAIKKRLAYFETDVRQTIDFFRKDGYFTFLDIDGTKSIEEVRDQIFSKIF